MVRARTVRDLASAPEAPKQTEWQRKNAAAAEEIIDTYPYCDEHGELLYEKVRLDPKDFYIRRPDGSGNYLPGIGDARRVLYRLPQVLAAPDLILIVEGEKDVASAEALGYVATCNPFGAKEWRREYSLFLRGKPRVLIIADNDTEGIAHGTNIKADLTGIVCRAVADMLPNGKDLTEWVEAGGTEEQFREWVEQQFQAAESGLEPLDSPLQITDSYNSRTSATPGASLGIKARTCATATPSESG